MAGTCAEQRVAPRMPDGRSDPPSVPTVPWQLPGGDGPPARALVCRAALPLLSSLCVPVLCLPSFLSRYLSPE